MENWGQRFPVFASCNICGTNDRPGEGVACGRLLLGEADIILRRAVFRAICSLNTADTPTLCSIPSTKKQSTPNQASTLYMLCMLYMPNQLAFSHFLPNCTRAGTGSSGLSIPATWGFETVPAGNRIPHKCDPITVCFAPSGRPPTSEPKLPALEPTRPGLPGMKLSGHHVTQPASQLRRATAAEPLQHHVSSRSLFPPPWYLLRHIICIAVLERSLETSKEKPQFSQ